MVTTTPTPWWVRFGILVIVYDSSLMRGFKIDGYLVQLSLWRQASEVLCNHWVPHGLNGHLYKITVRYALLYGA